MRNTVEGFQTARDARHSCQNQIAQDRALADELSSEVGSFPNEPTQNKTLVKNESRCCEKSASLCVIKAGSEVNVGKDNDRLEGRAGNLYLPVTRLATRSAAHLLRAGSHAYGGSACDDKCPLMAAAQPITFNAPV